MKIKSQLLFLFILAISSLLIVKVPNASSQAAIQSQASIAEVRISGEPINVDNFGSVGDFVSIFNRDSSNLDLTGWWLEYASSSDAEGCGYWNVSDNQTIQLSGTLASNALSLPISLEMAGNKSGSIRLIDNEGLVHDVVGWGSTAPCAETLPAEKPSGGDSIKRYLSCSGDTLLDTGNNQTDFMPPSLPSPGIMSIVTPNDCNSLQDDNSEEDDEDDDNEDLPAEITSDCDGVILSEVLPNPGGSDTGQEFIELHNPTNKSISLKNCKLQTSSKNTFFIFPTQNLKPGEYKAFYDTDTSLSLANASGGTVWLLDHQDAKLDEVVYPADMEDNVSYALFDSGWKSTYTPTPNEENTLQATKPCPQGQFRNLETNRCNKSLIVSALKPCRPDQRRNPETNRCRLISSLSSALKPCDPDQFRNPETNRCKKISSGSTLKPCRPGQERNPETNRCRKVEDAVLGDSLDSVKDVPSPAAADKISWWFAGASMFGAVGYAGFEWRKEFLQALSSLKSKFTRSIND